MIRFAGTGIRSLRDFSCLLQTHKAGDGVEVVILRAGKPRMVQVTLAGGK